MSLLDNKKIGGCVLKLTSDDKSLLLHWGYQAADFPQIEAALLARNTKYSVDGQTISQAKAIAILGQEQFLASISRSAFHATAARETKDGKTVLFDSSRLFKF